MSPFSIVNFKRYYLTININNRYYCNRRVSFRYSRSTRAACTLHTSKTFLGRMTYPAMVLNDPENIEGTKSRLGVIETGFSSTSSFPRSYNRVSIQNLFIFWPSLAVRVYVYVASVWRSTPIALPNATGVVIDFDPHGLLLFIREREKGLGNLKDFETLFRVEFHEHHIRICLWHHFHGSCRLCGRAAARSIRADRTRLTRPGKVNVNLPRVLGKCRGEIGKGTTNKFILK